MKNSTHIICVVDRSTSMGAILEQSISGYNKFIEEQKAHPGQATLQLVLFDHPGYVEAYRGDLASSPEMTSIHNAPGKITFSPQGCTALIDAVGKTMNSAGTYLNNLPDDERPDKVLCVILTDGQENASQEFSYHKISEMIAHQKDKYGWGFLFLGANVDSWNIANLMGIGMRNAVNFNPTGRGIQQAYMVSSKAASSYRNGGDVQSVVEKTTGSKGFINGDVNPDDHVSGSQS